MNTQLLEKIEKDQMKKVPDVCPGDLVRVHQKIKEGKKERVQVFEGVVLRVKGSGLKKSFIVRKISFGIGVEKCFLIHAPNIVRIEVKKRAKVRRAYLTYLRNLTGKGARLKDKQFDSLVVNVQEEKTEDVEEEKSEKKPTGEEKKDAEATELDKEAVSDVEAEVPLSEVAKEEEKQAASAAGDESTPDEGGQDAEVAEVAEGVAAAEDDIAKGKDEDEKKAEKKKEDTTQEEVKEEIKEEKEAK